MSKKPYVLCIMDGFGKNPSQHGNAIAMAKKPNLDKLMAECPYTYIGASGLDVGLPDGQMGNSEVGHTNMGAGRVVYQDLTRISKAFADGEAYKNEVLVGAMENAKDKALHLMGLVSPGGVHSHMTHLYNLLEMAKEQGVSKVYVHAFLDGRDVPPASAAEDLEQLQAKMNELGVGKIASVMGRFYAMDRDNIWDRVEKAYAAMVYGEGVQATDAVAAVQALRTKGHMHARHLRIILGHAHKIGVQGATLAVKAGECRIHKGTGNLPGTIRPEVKEDHAFAALHTALVANNGAHVTFFFNGGAEEPYPGEDRILVPSPKISTFDLMPEMSAPQVSEKLNEAVRSGKYDVVIVNFANCDMVGHTGVIPAAVKAVETVDACVGSLVQAVKDMDGVLFVTADHGNADKMLDENDEPFTAHTTNPVPFIVVNYPCTLREGGKLCDIAPTMLKLLNMEQPEEMTGKSIIL